MDSEDSVHDSGLVASINAAKSPNLLVSVFLSPNGIGKYRNKKVISPTDEFFRISRFLTSIYLLSKINFSSKAIYFETDEVWDSFKPQIIQEIKRFMPDSEIFDYRLLYRSQWLQSVKGLEPDDVILLHTNDDHAYVAQNMDLIYECCQTLAFNPELPMSAITHHPEMMSLVFRNQENCVKYSKNLWSVPVDYAVGTTLVRADFFNSWWSELNFEETDKIAKPDNPIGKSVRFPAVQMLIPKQELFRHMDGYSHVLTYRPLAPLRNLVRFVPYESTHSVPSSYSISSWPNRIFGFSRRGTDLHRTEIKFDESLINLIRTKVSILQASWGFCFEPKFLNEILPAKSKMDHISNVLAFFVALSTFPILRNLPDYLLESLFRFRSLPLMPNYKFLYFFRYHGFFRAILMRRAWNSFWKQSMELTLRRRA